MLKRPLVRSLLCLLVLLPPTVARATATVDLSGVWYARTGAGASLQRFVLVLFHDMETGRLIGTLANRELAEMDPAELAGESATLRFRERMLHGERVFEFKNVRAVNSSGPAASLLSDLRILQSRQDPEARGAVVWTRITGDPIFHHWRIKFDSVTGSIWQQANGTAPPLPDWDYWEGTYWFTSIDWGPGGPPMLDAGAEPDHAEPAYAMQHCRPLGCEARLLAHASTLAADNTFPEISFSLETVSANQNIPVPPEALVTCERIDISIPGGDAPAHVQTACVENNAGPQGAVNYTLMGSTRATDIQGVLALLNRFANHLTASAPPAAPFDADYRNDGVCYSTAQTPACSLNFADFIQQMRSASNNALQVMIAGVRRIRTDYSDPRIVALGDVARKGDMAGYSLARASYVANVEWSLAIFGPGVGANFQRFEFGLNEPLFWIKKLDNEFVFYGNYETAPLSLSSFYAAADDLKTSRPLEPAFLRMEPDKPLAGDHREGGRGWNLTWQSEERPIRVMAAGEIIRISPMNQHEYVAVLHRPGLYSSYGRKPGSGPGLGALVAAGQIIGYTPGVSASCPDCLPESKVTLAREGVFACPLAFFNADSAAGLVDLLRKVELNNRLTQPFACNASYTTAPLELHWSLVSGSSPLVYAQRLNPEDPPEAGTQIPVGAITFRRHAPTPGATLSATPYWNSERVYEFQLHDANGVAIPGARGWYQTPEEARLTPATQTTPELWRNDGPLALRIPRGSCAVGCNGECGGECRYDSYCARAGLSSELSTNGWHSFTGRRFEAASRLEIVWQRIPDSQPDACTGNFPAASSGGAVYRTTNPNESPLPF